MAIRMFKQPADEKIVSLWQPKKTFYIMALIINLNKTTEELLQEIDNPNFANYCNQSQQFVK